VFMRGQDGGVPYTPWEIGFWACAAAFAVLTTATAESTGGQIGGAILGLIVVAMFIWSRRIRHTQPGLLAKRMPTEVLWVLGFLGVLVLIEALGQPHFLDKLTGGLIALGLVLMAIADRTRPLPEGDLAIRSTGGYFDPATPIGMKRRLWAARGIILAAIVLAVVFALAAHDQVPLLLAGSWLLAWLLVFEPMAWLVKRRRMGYFALHDDESSGRVSKAGDR
jgi:hypothetical protein